MQVVIITSITRILLRLLGYGLLGGFIVAVVVYVNLLERSPDLSVWHHADLDAEFTVESDISNFDQYLELEDRLFAQLDEIVELVQASSIREHVLAELNLARFIRAIELDRKRDAEVLISDLEAYQQRLQ